MSINSVTAIIEREILPGKYQDFEVLYEKISRELTQFEGYLKSHIIKPKQYDNKHYEVFFRFDSQANLDKWLDSNERKKWVEQIDKLLKKPSSLQVITGFETWFALPGQKTITPPPRYKMAITSFLAITPLLICFNLLFGHLLMGISAIMRVIVSTPFIVLIMTYFWMPLITKLLKKWLYP